MKKGNVEPKPFSLFFMPKQVMKYGTVICIANLYDHVCKAFAVPNERNPNKSMTLSWGSLDSYIGSGRFSSSPDVQCFSKKSMNGDNGSANLLHTGLVAAV